MPCAFTRTKTTQVLTALEQSIMRHTSILHHQSITHLTCRLPVNSWCTLIVYNTIADDSHHRKPLHFAPLAPCSNLLPWCLPSLIRDRMSLLQVQQNSSSCLGATAGWRGQGYEGLAEGALPVMLRTQGVSLSLHPSLPPMLPCALATLLLEASFATQSWAYSSGPLACSHKHLASEGAVALTPGMF